MIVRGNSCRTMSPTEANATSSRSHAVLQINVSQKDRNADVNEPHTMATLSIIDLAGSERASATKNRGERLMEGANINKSLLALGSCINALCDPRKRNHVPYRNSKLTRLLKFSLGGNCKTVMIVCVSPSSAHFDETQNTLRYANRAKNIQTKVTRNVYNVNRHVKDFLKKIDEQMTLITELKQQQKEYESIAFAKFRKMTEKKEGVAKEGLSRIRSAYDHAAAERQERVTSMRKLRQLERRISLISSWIAAFDVVCENREDEEPPKNLVNVRKTANGILAELETSRQHYHQRLAKSNWDRALDTALQTGIKQLKDLGSSTDCANDIASLTREVELFKSMADREAHTSILEQEKGGESPIIQVLLQAHFDTIAIINQILSMDEREAVIAAKNTLGKLISSCSDATSQVVKPDGGLPAVEVFPPTKNGTPKRRKGASLIGPSPMKAKNSFLEAPHLGTPSRASPKRRKLGGPKRAVTFTPKKKSPVKGLKRGVRWRDDTEDGTLAEFQATPQPLDTTTPELSSAEMPTPPQPTTVHVDGSSNNSSPIPAPPEPSLDLKPRSSRFQAGFLSKKGGTSPNSMIPVSSSDSEHSPLQEIERNRVPFRSPLRLVESAASSEESSSATAQAAAAAADESYANSSSSDEEKRWRIDRSDATKIRSAMKRASSSGGGAGAGIGSGGHNGSRTQHRRSPTAASTGSPPSSEPALFSNSQARRMVKGEKDEWRTSVLSPRPGSIVKAAPVRRTTMGDERVKEGSALRAGPVRMSSVTPGIAPPPPPPTSISGRGSLVGPGKGAWR